MSLESVRTHRPPALGYEIAAELPAPDTFGAITYKIFDARRTGSRFLSNAEWDLLERAAPFWPDEDVLKQCALLHAPWRSGVPQEPARTVLLDARVLQMPYVNGSKNHALAVTRALVEAVPPDYSIAFLTSPVKPPLAQEIADLATTTWRPGLIGDVAIFVQLVTIMDGLETSNLDLLRSPWIKRVSVFLDDIQGIYPEHYIGTSREFWIHQLSIEKLRSSHVVLSLGATSQNEAIALWDSIAHEQAPPQFTITSCVGALPMTLKSDDSLPSNDFIVFGNHYAHKNVALVAAAARCARPRVTASPNFVFVADMDRFQIDALEHLASPPPRASSDNAVDIEFVSGLSNDVLSERLARARAAVIPSFHEGFSLPIVEALERGVPVVLSRIPAHLELLDEGPWFFDPNSVASLCSALEACDDSREAWLAQQRASLASRYSPETLSASVAAVTRALTRDRDQFLAMTGRDEVSEGRTQRGRALHTMADLEARDREFMGLVFAQRRMRAGSFGGPGANPSTTGVDHDSLVSGFRTSRTWRVVRVVVGPVNWLRQRFAGLSQ
jgi:glycosyltransferase involved in cell wall biosynthesis